MIVADTDMLSAFAKIGRLPLLRAAVRAGRLHVTPAIRAELQYGADQGWPDSMDVLAGLQDGSLVEVALTPEEQSLAGSLPVPLGAGEREGIALALMRGALLLSNESRVLHFCRLRGADCLRLPDILRALWVRGLATKGDVAAIMDDLRAKDRMAFRQRDVDAIFAG